MTRSVAKLIVLAASAAALGASLAGCAQERLSPDFGVAMRQDLAAQIADPDARYGKTPSNGAHVAQAYDRYQKGKIIQPQAAASQVGVTNSSANAPTLPTTP